MKMQKQTARDCAPNQMDPCQQVNPKFVPTSGYTGGTAGNITAKTQEPVFLKSLILGSDQDFLVDDIVIGNQSLNCSDSSIAGSLFKPTTQRKPLIGVAVDGNIQNTVSVTLDVAGTVNGAFSCEAIDNAPSIQAQQLQLNKFFGMGKVPVPAAAAGVAGKAQLSAQSLRGNVFLKSLVVQVHGGAPLQNNTDGLDITISDITIKGRSIFTGQSGDTVGSLTLDTVVQMGCVGINTLIDTNERVIISLENNSGAPVTVSAGFYAQ